jgi:hypothetical protein
MRKVKFAQDAFDEKLGAILTEFPMLDVCFRSFFEILILGHNRLCIIGPSPVLILVDERALRQKSLQARFRTASYRPPSDRPCCERLPSLAQVRRQLVQV